MFTAQSAQVEKQLAIQQAKPGEELTLLDMARQTFQETYGEFNDPLNMEIYLQEQFSESIIRKELEDPHARYFIASLDGKSVGFVKLRNDRKAKSLEKNRTIEIQRIYVLKEYQGYQIGKALMDFVKKMAREERYQNIWLQVWQKNQRALRFYQTAGFVVFDTTTFQLGKDIQADFLMKYDLYL